MKKTLAILVMALATAGTQAAVVVTDLGNTAPTINPTTDTGYEVNTTSGATNQRFGWNSGETFGQTFTIPAAGTLQSIYLGYNGSVNGKTITFNLTVDGGVAYSETGIVLDSNNFSGLAGDNNNGPVYWMQLDLSSETINLSAGLHSFSLAATAQTGGGFFLAPMYDSPGSYAGGALTGVGAAGDRRFAVTVVPEPTTTAFLGALGLLGLLRRRRS